MLRSFPYGRILATFWFVAIVACFSPTEVQGPADLDPKEIVSIFVGTETVPVESRQGKTTSAAGGLTLKQIPFPIPKATSTLIPNRLDRATIATVRPNPVEISQILLEPPRRDLVDIASRLRPGMVHTPKLTSKIAPTDLKVGDKHNYWVSGNLGQVRIVGRVERVTEHAFWVFDEVTDFSSDGLEIAIEVFENVIWPTVTEIFGGVATPGMDDQQRITILHTQLSSGVAGYYSSDDRYVSSIVPHSNEGTVLYINAESARVGTRRYLTTLTHELQHASHWVADPDEDTWVNEGLSALAARRAGFLVQNVTPFLMQPNTQLNAWASDYKDAAAHYGAASLFIEFLADHYGGDEFVKTLIKRPENGLDGIEAALDELGHGISGLDAYKNWVIANYLDADFGLYAYPNRSLRAGVSVLEELVVEPTVIHGSVVQFGTRYYVVRLGEPDLKIVFEGEANVPLFPGSQVSGESCWWGNRGNSIDTVLTRGFDLRSLDAAKLMWQVWYEIEEEWDYAYVEVSADGGEIWDVLPTKHTTFSNPNRTAYGPGYSGSSLGWVDDEVDLSPYAGLEILVRFEYVTDDAVSLSGICFDDFKLPEIDWNDDAEQDRGWEAAGFVRTSNNIPQDFLLQAIHVGSNGQAIVKQIADSYNGRVETIISGLAPQDLVVVVVSAVAPVTRNAATYKLELDH